MPSITKAPRDRWPEAARELEIVLLPGIHQANEFDDATDMVLRGGPGVSIDGSIKPSGEPPCGLRFHDGCHRLQIIGPLEFSNSEGRALRITVADDIVLSDIFCHHYACEGIITGSCKRGQYTNIRCEDSRSSPSGYAPDKRHGVYISGNADGSTVSGLIVSRVTGSGLQLNGAGMNEIINELVATRLEFYHCGSGGTPPLSMMACRNCRIEEFLADWTASDRWAVLFDDYKGESYACYDNDLRNYTVPRGTHPAEEGGSARNTFSAGAGWAPSPEPEPGPEPEPPPVENYVPCTGCVAHDPPYPAGQMPAPTDGEPEPPADLQPFLDEIEDALMQTAAQTAIAQAALAQITTQTQRAATALGELQAATGTAPEA